MRIFLCLTLILSGNCFASGCFDKNNQVETSSFVNEDWLRKEVDTVGDNIVLHFWLPTTKDGHKFNHASLIFSDNNMKDFDLIVEVGLHKLESESVGKIVLRKDFVDEAWLSIHYDWCDGRYNFRLKNLKD